MANIMIPSFMVNTNNNNYIYPYVYNHLKTIWNNMLNEEQKIKEKFKSNEMIDKEYKYEYSLLENDTIDLTDVIEIYNNMVNNYNEIINLFILIINKINTINTITNNNELLNVDVKLIVLQNNIVVVSDIVIEFVELIKKNIEQFISNIDNLMTEFKPIIKIIEAWKVDMVGGGKLDGISEKIQQIKNITNILTKTENYGFLTNNSDDVKQQLQPAKAKHDELKYDNIDLKSINMLSSSISELIQNEQKNIKYIDSKLEYDDIFINEESNEKLINNIEEIKNKTNEYTNLINEIKNINIVEPNFDINNIEYNENEYIFSNDDKGTNTVITLNEKQNELRKNDEQIGKCQTYLSDFVNINLPTNVLSLTLHDINSTATNIKNLKQNINVNAYYKLILNINNKLVSKTNITKTTKKKNTDLDTINVFLKLYDIINNILNINQQSLINTLYNDTVINDTIISINEFINLHTLFLSGIGISIPNIRNIDNTITYLINNLKLLNTYNISSEIIERFKQTSSYNYISSIPEYLNMSISKIIDDINNNILKLNQQQNNIQNEIKEMNTSISSNTLDKTKIELLLTQINNNTITKLNDELDNNYRNIQKFDELPQITLSNHSDDPKWYLFTHKQLNGGRFVSQHNIANFLKFTNNKYNDIYKNLSELALKQNEFIELSHDYNKKKTNKIHDNIYNIYHLYYIITLLKEIHSNNNNTEIVLALSLATFNTRLKLINENKNKFPYLSTTIKRMIKFSENVIYYFNTESNLNKYLILDKDKKSYIDLLTFIHISNILLK